MFSEELAKTSWDDTTAAIASKTENDVRIALAKERLNVDDFMALISPAAVPYLEQMARKSQFYTQERFGKIISMYIPLYLSNECSNHCVYCGFNYNNQFERTTLTEEQIKELAHKCSFMGTRTIGQFKVPTEEDMANIYRAAK